MHNRIYIIIECAIFVTIGIILEIISRSTGLIMPNGGNISISMIPIIAIGLRRGIKYSLISCLVFTILIFLLDGAVYHIGSIIFDYILAFGAYSLSGFFNKYRQNKLVCVITYLGIGIIRYIFHGLSGVIFFGSMIPDEYQNAVWFYSFIVYNLGYMTISTSISALLAYLLHNILFIYHTEN